MICRANAVVQFMKSCSYKSLPLWAGVCLLATSTAFPAAPVARLTTFGTMGKQLSILSHEHETDLFQHTGKGCLTHMWFGGNFKDYDKTRLRVYVDSETTASIDVELFLGHGIGFADSAAPWGVARIGKTGDPSGIYNTYRIPFGKAIRVTAQLAPGSPDHPDFWWIIRGTENLPVQLGGVTLPDAARLKVHRRVDYLAQRLEEFSLCDVKSEGALYQVTIAAKGLRTSTKPGDRWKDLSYLESCMRAYIGGATNPLYLSSGLEDYFLGTYYFNKGLYYTPVAGLTHLDKERNEFSAYRFHEDDPVFFHRGLRLTCRCGETLNGKGLWDPPQTQYTTYVWLYQW